MPSVNILTHSLETKDDGLVSIQLFGRELNKNTTPSLQVLDAVSQKAPLSTTVAIVDSLTVCPGNDDPSLVELADKKGEFVNIKKQVVAKVENGTARHINCTMLIDSGSRCDACSKHRKTLIVKCNRKKKRKQG